MSRSVNEQHKSYRAVIVYKKSEPNPKYVAPKYYPEYIPGNGEPQYFWLDEPGDFTRVYGPYSRPGDATAAGNREGRDKYGNLRESVFRIYLEEAELKWKEVK